MGRRHLGPGPGKYMLPPLVGFPNHDPSRYRNPQYTMRPQIPIIQRDISPGPKYHTENMTMYGKTHPPAYSQASRRKELKAFQGPGPAAYNLQDSPRMKEQRPPAFSLASRHKPLRPFETPAPNNYNVPSTLGPKVPDIHADGAFSMSFKYPLISKVRSPGPAAYTPTSPNAYKNKLPAYSMSIRHKVIKDRNPFPGPSNYYPKPPAKGGYSFGLKTDNAPYITADDEMPCINK